MRITNTIQGKNPLMSAKTYYVYIMANFTNTVLYTGMTNDLYRRVLEHKSKKNDGFTKRYHVTKLVYFEEASNPAKAIAREKQIKGWVRRKKIALFEEVNPEWNDLSEDWYS
jgi:putative endonuclease